MDISSPNNNSIIQISSENLEKLRLVLEQLNIKIDTQNSLDNHSELNIQTKSTENVINKNIDMEDDLEPWNVTDLSDSIDEIAHNNANEIIDTIPTNIDIKNDCNIESMVANIKENNLPNNLFLTTNNDNNEITPDDIINDDNDENDSELDLASDDDIATQNISYVHHPNLIINDNIDISKIQRAPITQSSLSSKIDLSQYHKEKNNQKTTQMCDYGILNNIPLDHIISKNISSMAKADPMINVSETKFPIFKSQKIDKITLDVGGKKFSLKKKLLDHLGINYIKLHKFEKDDGKIIYFLDRDPYYFSKIINIIKIYGFNEDKIIEHLDDYSEQLISELCHYGLINKKYTPRPKLKLKRMVTFPSRHDDIIKIIIDDQIFETSSSILSRSNYFDIKLKKSRSKQFYLSNIDPKLFRYVLNFLRTGELYVSNTDIINLLDSYQVEFDRIENKKIKETIVSHHIPHTIESIHSQMLGCLNHIDPRLNIIPKSNNMYQFIDNKYYYPKNMYVSPNVENFNVITTDSQLSFDSDIIFNLTDATKDYGECIEDMLLCIDIPVLKPTEAYEYVDMIEYSMIDHIKIVRINDIDNKVLLQTNGDLLYMYPIIYTDNPLDYRSMTKIGDKKIKLLYNNTLIDIYRITLPLFLFIDRQNILPIKKLIANNISLKMVVRMAPLKKLFKSKIKDIPLLNVSLLTNFVSLAPGMNVIKQIEKTTSVSIAQINMELLYSPMIYIYHKVHILTIPIETTPNAIYDIVTIPLNNFNLIKDFFLTIHKKEDFINDQIDKFSDELIELEIYNLKENPQTKQKNFILHTKLDSIMLNYYIPIKRLGHTLPMGVYYHSFSPEPKSSQMMGGLDGTNYLIRIKLKKNDGFVKFYVSEYQKEFF